jgi:hypothetical protein
LLRCERVSFDLWFRLLGTALSVQSSIGTILGSPVSDDQNMIAVDGRADLSTNPTLKKLPDGAFLSEIDSNNAKQYVA